MRTTDSSPVAVDTVRKCAGVVLPLRFMSERIRDPNLSIVRTLKFDFVAAASHHGEESVAVCDSKGFEQSDRRSWKRSGRNHPNHLHGGRVKDPNEQPRGCGYTQRS